MWESPACTWRRGVGRPGPEGWHRAEGRRGCACRRLAQLGQAAWEQAVGVAPFQERWRDTHDFARRASRLPEQQEGDIVDYRGLLHRDGSVLSAVTLRVRASGCSTKQLPGSCPAAACCCGSLAVRVLLA